VEPLAIRYVPSHSSLLITGRVKSEDSLRLHTAIVEGVEGSC
jgi:hypothetical protein